MDDPLVEIVGLTDGSRGRSCESHNVCGSTIDLDSLVRFRIESIDVDGKEERAICVYSVSDGIDRCRVGFLPRHYKKYAKKYNGRLAQVVELLWLSEESYLRSKSHRNRGMCKASLLEEETDEAESVDTTQRNESVKTESRSPLPKKQKKEL